MKQLIRISLAVAMFLQGSVDAASATPLIDPTTFPAYAQPPSIADDASAAKLAYDASLNPPIQYGGYQCIRSKMAYGWAAYQTGSSVSAFGSVPAGDDKEIRPFYGWKVTH